MVYDPFENLHKLQAVTIQSEFNGKARSSKDATLTQGNPNGGGSAACAHQKVTPQTASKAIQNLCAFAPLRLCVESLLHRYGQDDVWGQIRLNDGERDIIDPPEYQRLFRTSQLGFVELVDHTANHTRGALHWCWTTRA